MPSSGHSTARRRRTKRGATARPRDRPARPARSQAGGGGLPGACRPPGRPGPRRAGGPPAGQPELRRAGAAVGGPVPAVSRSRPGSRCSAATASGGPSTTRCPPPPPHHVRGRDKITIHEDTDGDGIFDRHKTFVDGLNIATSVRSGAGAASGCSTRPTCSSIPTANGDDVPDGDPEVHLEGFRARGHAFGRQQPALGARRLDLRRPGDAPSPATSRARARRRQGAGPLDGPAHLAISSRDAPLRGLRRGGRQRLRRRDRRQGPDLLGPQRRRHPRASTTSRGATSRRASTSTGRSRTPTPSATSPR